MAVKKNVENNQLSHITVEALVDTHG